jgi:hypothetical protein
MTLFPLLPKCWDCGPIPPCLHLNIVFPLKTTRISSTAFSSLLIQDLIFYASPPFLINQKLDWWHLVSMSFSVWLCDWSGLLGGQAKGSGLTLYSNGGAFGNGGAAGEWMWKCPMANQVISHTAAMCSVCFDSTNCTCSNLGGLPSGYWMAKAQHQMWLGDQIPKGPIGLCVTVQTWESSALGGMRC